MRRWDRHEKVVDAEEGALDRAERAFLFPFASRKPASGLRPDVDPFDPHYVHPYDRMKGVGSPTKDTPKTRAPGSDASWLSSPGPKSPDRLAELRSALPTPATHAILTKLKAGERIRHSM